MEKDRAIKWLQLFNDKIQINSDYLNQLDTPIGDGDHGANMARGMAAVIVAFDEKDLEDAASVFKIAAMELLAKVGGASGPLYWAAFTGIGNGLENNQSLVDALSLGLDNMKNRGKAEVGAKTMIDVWQPVIELLTENGRLNDEIIEGFVSDTKDIVATKGRASYLGERSLGQIDPGAYSSGLFFQAMVEAGVSGDE